MSDKKEDKKELATNRLLEILRGDSENAEAVSQTEERLGLTDEEQSALESSHEIYEDNKDGSKKKDILSVLKEIFDDSINKIQKLTGSQKGMIGIDVGSDSIKFVLFQKGKTGFVLKDMGSRKIEEHYTGDPKKKIENLNRAVNELISSDLKSKVDFSITVYGPEVSIKKISLPKMTGNELKEAIYWNAKKDLPFPPENAAIGYRIIGTVEDQGMEKTEVIVAAVDRKLISEKIEYFEKLDIHPVNISPVPLAIYNNFQHYSEITGQTNGVVIDIGARMSHIIFVEGGNLQFAREISTGGDDITKGMMGSLSGSDGVVKIDREEAERLKFVYGIPSDDIIKTTEHGISLSQVSSVMRPTLERLLVQIQRSFDYYRTKFPFEEPDKVFITGGTSLLKNIVEFISDGLDKQVEILNPLRGIIVDPELEEEKSVSSVAPSLTVAIGSILGSKNKINLLPQEMKEKLLFDVQKIYVGLAAGVAFFIILLMSFFANSSINELQTTYEEDKQDSVGSTTYNTAYNTLLAQKAVEENKILMEQQNYEKFAGTVQLYDYILFLSGVHKDYIIIDYIKIDLERDNILDIAGRINVDRVSAETMLTDYQLQYVQSGMFQSVVPFTSGDVAYVEGPGGDNRGMSFEIRCLIPQSVSVNK
ncbi:pilus assembly protein PilM [candidate division KSB1 bacterium]